MQRALIWVGGGLAALIVAGVAALNLSALGQIYIPAGTGIVAKQTCSLTWVSGLDPDRARAMYLDPLLGDAGTVMSADIDEEARTVRASALGLWGATAVWRDGLGCTLVHRPALFDADLTVPWEDEPDYFDLDMSHRDANFDTETLSAAVDAAFGGEDDPRNTMAVAVFHQGRLVAERYGNGADRTTRLHGWSMTKSAMATLAGVLTQQGRLDITEAGQVAGLAERTDDADAQATTIEDLLRMTGGRAVAELNNGFDPNSDMLMTEPDMVAFSATRERLHPPGAHWQYMSGDTILATATMQRLMGDTLEEQTRAIRDELFEPLGIRTAILEPDNSGTFQGSSYLYMTAHDWARLLMPYTTGGIVNGEQFIPENWAEIVSTPTEGSGGIYGMGFWIPNARTPEVRLPDDAFNAQGFQGQYGFVIPSEDLVIIRMGATNGVQTRAQELAASVVAARRG
ncbi:serine hydrolase domain-containing protein [Hyphobacterium marinum]|uniref:Serine hydrolase n=1 Tax=Hyphobacterium marinum TaxID=3116574 RepID=A0ABU7LWQ2_9PROT|nr:serine hydrolase [Hyphobacterium sp. Y6023]MEE2565988.1 serine hydrolase [Hyphobacterium sp. Y6023]